MIDSELTALEIIGVAIVAEREAYDVYGELARRVANPSAQRTFQSLAAEERLHEDWLSSYYRDMTGQAEPPPVPNIQLNLFGPAFSSQLDTAEVLAVAIERERHSEQVYAEAARRSTDASGKRLLEELVEFERLHARKLELLRAEARRDPGWFDDRSGRSIRLEGP